MALIDFVRWETEPGKNPIYAWKYRDNERPNNNLSTLTQLIVAESQEAVLFTKGQILGKFGPGKHTLSTENLPLLRSLFGLPFGGKNPFTAEIWFVNKLMPLNIEWHTDAMMFHDPDYNTMIPLLARGTYGLKVVDAEKFLINLVGTAYQFDARQLTDHFKGAMISKTKSILLQNMQSSRVGIKSISAYLDTLSANMQGAMQAFWQDYGLELKGFYLTSVDVDPTSPAGAKIMGAMSDQSAQAIGGYTWQQQQAFNTADKAIDSSGGGGGGQGSLLGAIMATSMMGNMAGGLLQPMPMQGNNPMGAPAQQQQPATGYVPAKDVYCSNCSKKFANNMKFCPHCGDPYTPCPVCGSDNDKHAKRCVSCGTQLTTAGEVCSGCQTAMPAGSAFCPNCGKPSVTVNAEDNCKRCGTKLNNSQFCPQCGLKKN